MSLKNGAITAFLAVVVTLAIGLTIWTDNNAKDRAKDIENAQIAMCERVKHDRIDNARAWTAVELVIAAQSRNEGLPENVREAYRRVSIRVGESANQLRSRLFWCEELIRDNRQVIDDRALREAQGKL